MDVLCILYVYWLYYWCIYGEVMDWWQIYSLGSGNFLIARVFAWVNVSMTGLISSSNISRSICVLKVNTIFGFVGVFSDHSSSWSSDQSSGDTISGKRSNISGSAISTSSCCRFASSYGDRSGSLKRLSRIRYFFTCALVRCLASIHGTNSIHSFFAAIKRQCHQTMMLFSSISIGTRNQNDDILLASISICFCGCFLLLNSYQINSDIGFLVIFSTIKIWSVFVMAGFT